MKKQTTRKVKVKSSGDRSNHSWTYSACTQKSAKNVFQSFAGVLSDRVSGLNYECVWEHTHKNAKIHISINSLQNKFFSHTTSLTFSNPCLNEPETKRRQLCLLSYLGGLLYAGRAHVTSTKDVLFIIPKWLKKTIDENINSYFS